MAKSFIYAIGLIACFATPLDAAVDFNKVRQAEKISIALTGKPLSSDLRKKFVSEQITLDGLADKLSATPGFIDHFAQFWTKLIGLQSPIDIYLMKNSKGQYLDDVIRGRVWTGLDPDREKEANAEYLSKYLPDDVSTSIELDLVQCPDAPLLVWKVSKSMIPQLTRAAVDGFGADTTNPKPIQPGTKEIWQRLLNLAKETTAECDEAVASVKPYWDPEKVTVHSAYSGVTSYKVPAKVLELCGPAMIKCNLSHAAGYDSFVDDVGRDISMEPGYLIAHTVAEDKPFSDVVTSSATIMTGTYGYFLNGLGESLQANFPGGGIQDSGNAIFKAGRRHDRKHYWINRGPANAGILTTPAFQILTNGRRAKANRAYETFLCKKFIVPDGAQPDPKDSEPDLTKRTYCTYCHKSLEPMAAFFNRWPTTGVTEFLYDNTPNVNDRGRFNGVEGEGVAAFGKILADSESFDDCSIRRAFEFVNGRKMTYTELENRLPSLLAEFRGAQKSLRAVIKSLVLSPEFLTPKGGRP
jgi:hypothetical protein